MLCSSLENVVVNSSGNRHLPCTLKNARKASEETSKAPPSQEGKDSQIPQRHILYIYIKELHVSGSKARLLSKGPQTKIEKGQKSCCFPERLMLRSLPMSNDVRGPTQESLTTRTPAQKQADDSARFRQVPTVLEFCLLGNHKNRQSINK